MKGTKTQILTLVTETCTRHWQILSELAHQPIANLFRRWAQVPAEDMEKEGTRKHCGV
jgi:hypothetical protein